MKESQQRIAEMHIFHPDPSGTSFEPLGMGVTRSFTVLRCASAVWPRAKESFNATQDSPHLLGLKIRPRQPQGLKPSYHPIGCGNDTLDAEALIAPVEQSGFKAPEKSGIDDSTAELRENIDRGNTTILERHPKVPDIAHDSLAFDQAKKRQKARRGTLSEDQTPTREVQHNKPRKRKFKD